MMNKAVATSLVVSAITCIPHATSAAPIIDVQFRTLKHNVKAAAFTDIVSENHSEAESTSVALYANAGDVVTHQGTATYNVSIGHTDFTHDVRRPFLIESKPEKTNAFHTVDEPFFNYQEPTENFAEASASGQYSLRETSGGKGAVFNYQGSIEGLSRLFAIDMDSRRSCAVYDAGSDGSSCGPKRVSYLTTTRLDAVTNIDAAFDIFDEQGNKASTPFSMHLNFLTDGTASSGSAEPGYYYDGSRTHYIDVRTDGGEITSATRGATDVLVAENTSTTRFTAERSDNELAQNITSSRADYKITGEADYLRLNTGLWSRKSPYDDVPLNIKDSVIASIVFGEGATQANPIMPDVSDDERGIYQFSSGASGSWFDPIVFENYLFSMDSNSFFTDILSFPTGFGANFGLYGFDDEDNVFDLGSFLFTDSVDFTHLVDADITSFLVTGIEDDDDTHQFPIQLGFSTSVADFSMQGIEDAAAFLASFNTTPSDADATVSEPGTLAMLSIACMLMSMRLRKHSK